MIEDKYQYQKGQFLILALIFTSLVIVNSLLAVTRSNLFLKSSSYTTEELSAINLAEAGLDKAVATLTQSGGSYSGEGGFNLGNGFVEISVVPDPGRPTGKKVTATAFIPSKASARVTRSISSTIDRVAGLQMPYAILGGTDGVYLGNNTQVRNLGSVFSNGPVIMGSGARITGDLFLAGNTLQYPEIEQPDCNYPPSASCQSSDLSDVNTVYDMGQSFVPQTSGTLTKALVQVRKFGSPNNGVNFFINGNINVAGKNLPNAAQVLGTGKAVNGNIYSIPDSIISANRYAWIELNFNPAISLVAGTRYWLSNESESTTTGANYYQVRYVRDLNIGGPTPTPTPTPQNTPTPTAIPNVPVNLTVQVNSSAGDVNESGSTFLATDTAIRFGGCGQASCYAGFRFTGVNLPKNAVLTSAKLEVVSNTWQWITNELDIYGDGSGNSPAFSSSSKPSSRTPTTARFQSLTDEVWLNNTAYQYDVIPIIQELVNRADWSSGNSMSVILKALSPNGFGAKFVFSYNSTPSKAAKLIVTYLVPGPTPTNGPFPTSTPTPTPTPTPAISYSYGGGEGICSNPDNSWSDLGGDILFKLFITPSSGQARSGLNFAEGVRDGSVNSTIDHGVYSHTIRNLNIQQSAYFQSVDNNSIVAGFSCPNANCHPGSADYQSLAFPISETLISTWMNQAQTASTRNGDINSCISTWGPEYVNGNVTLNNCGNIDFKSPVYINGNLNLQNNTHLKLNSSYGKSSGILIVSGQVTIGSGNSVEGTGASNSTTVLISEGSSQTSPAILVSGDNNTKLVLYAQDGIVEVLGSNSIERILARRAVVRNNSPVSIDNNPEYSSLEISGGITGEYGVVKGTYKLE